MKTYKKWAERKYSLSQRLFALVPAGALFAVLIPVILVKLGPLADQGLGLAKLDYGIVNLLIGGILIAIGVLYAFWSISDQLFRAQGTPLPMMATQKLLVTGPFKQCRNPMSFGTMALYLGISIAVGSVTAIGIALILSVLLIQYLKMIEEKELEMRFGEAFLVYKKSTPFLIPRLGRRNTD
jgi:protein-S-isoprenylcysteine O-methyltransferase Ste14